MKEINVGDVLFGSFEFNEGKMKKIRPLLVLEVFAWGVRVAYGTSQVDRPLEKTEVELSMEEAALVGLKKATRFNLGRRQIMPNSLDHPAWRHYGETGNILVLLKEASSRMVRAAIAAGLA